jgi:multidrug resistance efflux pump
VVIMTTLYLIIVWLVFGKFKLLPFNKFWSAVVMIIGIIIVNVFLSGLGALTPASQQAIITGPVTEIAPQVAGRVISVPLNPQEAVEPGDTLFEIDPRPYQYRVDQLIATLVDTEAGVASLKESYDAARANVRALQVQLDLTELRVRQQTQLVEAGAGQRQLLEQYEATAGQLQNQLQAAVAQENQSRITLNSSVGDQQSRVAQVLAQLESAQFDLENTTVTAPAGGAVSHAVLRPGMYVSPSRAVITFAYTDTLFIAGIFAQKALEWVRPGQTAKINFPGLPGRLFEGRVIHIPQAVGEGQFLASGQLPRLQDQRMTRSYPILISLPDDFPPELRRLGVAASVRIHTDGAGIVGMVAVILQWVQTSLDYIL